MVALVALDGDILPPGPRDHALTVQTVVRPERKVDARPVIADEDALTVEDCCRMFEEAEEASQTARELAERDRDFYDGKQLSAEETAELRKRGQPEVVFNMVRQKVNYLIGLEKQQRTKPRAAPRTPMDENDAHAITDALRYVVEKADFNKTRSAIWNNLLIEGAGACSVTVKPRAGPIQPGQQPVNVEIKHYPWDRFFADPHSSRPDYEDAGYKGFVLWMDQTDALAMYGAEYADVINATLTTGSLSTTYDDKPSWMVWADRKRKRIRVVQMWVKRGGEWYFCEFTKGGFFKSGPSPYVNEDGHTDCPIIAQSSYVDRDNNRYGEVRELISPQEEINKRRSKSLHLLNTAQVVAEEGAVADEEKARREAVKPDGWITLNPGMKDAFRFETRSDMASGQFKLLEHAMNTFALMGPNSSMEGDTAQVASGRAILASQQGGMVQMGASLDALRDLDVRVYRAATNRIRQYWDAPMWVRVTDDERNIRFVGINGAPHPVTGQPGPMVGQLDVDIIIDDAPDGVAPALEQFQALVELKKFDANNEISFRTIVEAMPNLRNKDKLLDAMDQHAAQAQQQGPPPELQAKMAELQLKQQGQQADIAAQQQKTEADIAAVRMKAETDRLIALENAMLEDQMAERKARREEAATKAKIDMQREAHAEKLSMAREEKRHAMALEAWNGQGDPAEEPEDPNAALTPLLERIASGVEDLKSYAEGGKTLIKDRNGMVTHVRTALGLAPVLRDAAGHTTGLGAVIQEGQNA